MKLRALFALMCCLPVLAACSARTEPAIYSGRVTDDTVTVAAPALPVPSSSGYKKSAASGHSTVSTVPALVGLGKAMRIEAVNVGVGALVEAGQQVAALDDDALVAQVEVARAAKQTARAQLEVLGVRLDDVDDARSTITENRDTVRDAITKLEDTKSELVAKLAEARSQREQIAAALAQLPSSVPPTLPPGVVLPDRDQLAAALDKLDTGIAELTEALGKVEAGLAEARSGLTRLDDASAQTADARAALTGVQRTARAALDGRDAAIEIASAQLDLAVLHTPVDGIVVATVQRGEAVATGAPVVVIRPSAPSAIDLWVTPQTAAALSVGQDARVRIDSRPGESFSARVSTIGMRALFPPTWSATTEVHLTRAIPVRVTLTDDTVWLPPGTPADVEITTDR